MTTHHKGENYSARNPVPTVKNHAAEIEVHKTEAEAMAAKQAKDVPLEDRPAPGEAQGSQEKKEMMDRVSGPKKKPNQRLEIKGERTVKDPVTGMDVVIRDAELDPMKMDMSKHDPKSENSVESTLQPPPDPASVDVKHPAPIPAPPSNILLQSFPPPVEAKSMLQVRHALTGISGIFVGGLAIIWLFTAFGHGFLSFLWKSTLIGALAVTTIIQIGVTANQVEKEIERVRFEMHRQRGEQHSPPMPESTEWLNAFIATFMGLLNPEFFLPIADQIEDVMQASLPGFIDAVKVSDLGQGTNPFRIISMRGLPDQPGDKGYPKEEWIDGGMADEERKKRKEERRDAAEKAGEVGKKEDFTDQAGDYVNFEVSFAYQARPGQSNKLRSHNIHLMIEFFIGVYDWLHIPVPIWVQVEGLVGTVRVRTQMIPEFPYVRNLTFTMMGVPKIQVSAKPMIEKIPNILDLPLISGFVQSSIAAACAEYVAPKSMTMNLQEMMSGAGITESTHATGVIVVTIHHATGLSAQDSAGKSDPYIVLAYAKFGKPLYSSRIIQEDLNPVFEETAFLLLSEDEIKAKEELSVMLWDSDQRSADDLVGRVQLPISEIISKPNQITRRTDKLRGFENADQMTGELTWSVGYFAKAPLQARLQKDLLSEEDHEPTPAGQPSGPKTPAKAMVLSPTNTPPSREWPSGILSVIVHHINNLERANLKGASGDREGAAGQDVTAPSDQDDNLPSSYCEIIVNDNMIFKTRVKQYTTQPFFEAGTEQFVRDWRDTVLRIAVRDSRLREKDPLLGVITIDLESLFADSHTSQVTQLFSIQDGVGFGRAQISVLFQPVEYKLPRNLLGWNTATLEITSPITIEMADERAQELSKKKLKIITSEDTLKIPSHNATVEGGVVTYQIGGEDGKLRLPVYERYKSAVVFEIGGREAIGPLSSQPDVMAALWMQTLVDDEAKEIRIPLIQGDKLTRLRQHFINDQLQQTHKYTICGYLKCHVRLDPGLDPDHAKYATTPVARHTFEAFDNAEGQAEQAERNAHANDDGVVDKDERKAIEAAHKHALNSRHRGSMQYAPVRTSVWMVEGVRKRARSIKNKVLGRVEKEEHVPTEGAA